LHDQVKDLSGRGHHVEVWCPPTADIKFLPLDTLVPEHVVPLATMPPCPRSPIRRRRYFAQESDHRAATLEEHCRRCGEQARSGGFDLLLAHPCQFFHTSPAAKHFGLPSLLYLQEPCRRLYEAMTELPWKAPEPYERVSWFRRWNMALTEALKLHSKRVQVRQELAWAASYGQILANSLFSRESILRAYNLDSRVCYLGIDADDFRPTGRPKEPFVIGVGNLSFNKRVLLAVQAVGAIPADRRPRLVWVGNRADEGYLDELRDTARRLGVDFVPRILISQDELRDLLSRAAVMIYTSHLEPFGYAPLEANACGTGVVAIAEGGIRETVDHPASGVLVGGADPALFARELVRFTDDLAFAKEFGLKAHDHVRQHWSQAAAMDRLEDELRRVAKIV